MAISIKDKISKHLLKTEDGRTIRMGVGCAWVGRGESYKDTLDTDLDLLMTSYEKGFRYYDTSRAYGESEFTVGEFVKRIPRESIFLATKSPFPFRDNPNAFQVFKDNFYQSFERLQTDHIDLFQIHDTNHFECCLPEVIPFLLERRDEGMISYIGMGMVSLNALELGVRSGYINSVLSFLQYSLLKKSADSLIRLTNERDVAFINASVLHFGLIKSADPMNQSSWGRKAKNLGHVLRNKQLTVQLQNKCKEMGIPIIAAAMQYSLLNPFVDLTLNGLARMSNLDSTMDSLNTVIYPDQWAEIFRLQEQESHIYIQDDLPR